MASEIESALYGEMAEFVNLEGHVGEHCLVEFSIRRDSVSEQDILRISVVPESREYEPPTVATFAEAHFGQFQQVNYDPEYNYLPWSIVGFHCLECEDNIWSFQLNCTSVRVSWSSRWPTIERPT